MIERIINGYKREKRNKEIECYLAEALYRASSLSSYTSFENILKAIGESGYGALSEEFRKAHTEVRGGESMDTALERIAKRNESRILKRTIDILVNGYRTGMDLSEALKETAEDAEKILEIERENNASMIVEKYTILFAGGVIVPLILGTMIALVSGLDLSSLSEFGVQANDGVLQNAILGNQVYVVIYSIIASLFIAFQENKKENSVLYMALLLPLAIVLFNAARYLF